MTFPAVQHVRPTNWHEAAELCTSENFPITAQEIKSISWCHINNVVFGIFTGIGVCSAAIAGGIVGFQNGKNFGIILFGLGSCFSLVQLIKNINRQRQLREKMARDELEPAHPYLNWLLDLDARAYRLIESEQKSKEETV